MTLRTLARVGADRNSWFFPNLLLPEKPTIINLPSR